MQPSRAIQKSSALRRGRHASAWRHRRHPRLIAQSKSCYDPRWRNSQTRTWPRIRDESRCIIFWPSNHIERHPILRADTATAAVRNAREPFHRERRGERAMKVDRRDRGKPDEKEWQEFRTAFAAARLCALLLVELEGIVPDYAGHLHRRLNQGIATGEGQLEEDPTADGPALIPGPTGGEPTMMDLSAALLLEEHIFPDRERADPRDFQQTTRGMVVVILH